MTEYPFSTSTLKDLALITCKSRATELAKLQQQEKQQCAAAQLQDQEELKAIEARIRQACLTLVSFRHVVVIFLLLTLFSYLRSAKRR